MASGAKVTRQIENTGANGVRGPNGERTLGLQELRARALSEEVARGSTPVELYVHRTGLDLGGPSVPTGHKSRSAQYPRVAAAPDTAGTAEPVRPESRMYISCIAYIHIHPYSYS